jgi:hypothetical protein
MMRIMKRNGIHVFFIQTDASLDSGDCLPAVLRYCFLAITLTVVIPEISFT